MLYVDLQKSLAEFTLEVQLSVGNEILVLFGPSGSGKTTILKMIAGLLRPDGGVIRYGDQVFFSSEQQIFLRPQARRIGYMFQNYALFPHMTVEKNIWYGVQQADKQNAKVLYERLMHILKIGRLSSRGINQLSGGERQRVALARALMAKPDILLLDEPMSAVDKATRLELQLELKQLQASWQIPFILVTHDWEEAQIMGNRFFFIERGRQTAPVRVDASCTKAMMY